MIPYRCKNNLIYKEFDEIERKEFFDLRRQKFIHNIDTLYYVVYTSEDYNYSSNVEKMINYLEHKKKIAIDTMNVSIYSEIDSSLVTHGLGFGMFAYSVEKKDKYIFFITRKRATDDTPDIIVQLRSQYLWQYGEHKAVEDSFKDLKMFLEYFNIEIWRTQENRIDYAYHTNYIQDPLNFFKEENLNKMQVSNFKRWHKEGRFVGDETVECDYITLGRRKSNNTFIRIYEKTQEVINQQYKQFFLKVWLMNGLINRYDYNILEKSFLEGSYNYIDKARLEFYLKYGKNKNVKDKINIILSKNNSMQIKNYADKITPKVTIIVNIEFQTKRKFYSTLDNSINVLKSVTCNYKELERIFKIIDNKDIFHSYITRHVIRFIDFDSATRKSNCKTSNWWTRLQSVKLNNVITGKNRKLIREYQQDLDIKNMKSRLLNSLSTFSLYLDKENNDTIEKDIIAFMSYINETDVQKSLKYKQKKSPLLQNRIAKNKSKKDINFAIVDLVTGEILG